MKKFSFVLLVLLIIVTSAFIVEVQRRRVAEERADALLEMVGEPRLIAGAEEAFAVELTEHERIGPFFSRVEALERADRLRRHGFHCEVLQEGLLRWFVVASKRK